jgi:hypothetical protein
MESALLALLPELAPQADDGEWQDVNLRGLCQELKTRSGLDFVPEELMKLLHSLARPFGNEENNRRALFDVRLLRREILKVRLLRPGRISARLPKNAGRWPPCCSIPCSPASTTSCAASICGSSARSATLPTP